jgi:DNA-3-methyladenine glycosylase I
MADKVPELVVGDDGVARCWWSAGSPEYRSYHDREWGFPVTDDQRLFEKISLEGFQAGLSWIMVLRKRDGLRRAFNGFDFNRLARVRESSVERLLQAPVMIRNRAKVKSVLNNARRAVEMVKEEGSLARFLWRYEPKGVGRPKRLTRDVLRTMTTCAEAEALSKELKRRGWTFVGPTTLYALMQAMGLVNDHLHACPARARSLALRQKLKTP